MQEGYGLNLRVDVNGDALAIAETTVPVCRHAMGTSWRGERAECDGAQRAPATGHTLRVVVEYPSHQREVTFPVTLDADGTAHVDISAIAQVGAFCGVASFVVRDDGTPGASAADTPEHPFAGAWPVATTSLNVPARASASIAGLQSGWLDAAHVCAYEDSAAAKVAACRPVPDRHDWRGNAEACRDASSRASMKDSAAVLRSVGLGLGNATWGTFKDDTLPLYNTILGAYAQLVARLDPAMRLEVQRFTCVGGSSGACRDACNAGDLASCYVGCWVPLSSTCHVIGEHLLKGDGVPRNPVLAQGLFAFSCNVDGGRACLDLAKQAAAGDGVPRDPLLARMVALHMRVVNKGAPANADLVELGSLDAALASAGTKLPSEPPHEQVRRVVKLQTCLDDKVYHAGQNRTGVDCTYAGPECQEWVCVQEGDCYSNWNAARISHGLVLCDPAPFQIKDREVVDDSSPPEPFDPYLQAASALGDRMRVLEKTIETTAGQQHCKADDGCCQAWARINASDGALGLKQLPAC